MKRANEPALDVLLLGLVEIRSAHAPMRIDRPLERALLTRLALARGAPVSDERLIADLWGDPEPASPVHRLRVLVSRTRGSLGAGAPELRRVPAGYALTADPVDLVAARAAADRLHAARRAGDAAAVRGAARDALASWRGPALADLRTIPYAAIEGERLDAWRLDLLVERTEADLALGAAGEAIDELTRLVAEHPLHERLSCLLALALYRTGRQAAALERLAGLRRVLRGELGLDLAPETAAMEVALLRQDPELRTPAEPVTIRTKPRATGFIGRDEDLATLSARLTRPGLVTLVGEPGSGKSRLAMEVVRSVAAAGRKVTVVELAPLRGDGAVAAAVESAAGAGAAALDGTLLVLDNAEHLIAQVAELCVTLSGHVPGLSVLITSQRPLHVQGEELHRVRPLDPDAAIRLLELRCAPDALPAAPADLDTVCAAVDRLPLGIELAAGLTRTMTVPQLIPRLDDRLRLLVGGSRDAGTRHTSLRAALDWSHGLLHERERAVLRRIAVFPGGFTLEAAEHVVGHMAGPELAPGDLAPTLTELVDRCLLTVEAATGIRRFRLLETVRAYARAELVAAGELDSTRAGYLSWRRAYVRIVAGDADRAGNRRPSILAIPTPA